MSTKLFEVRPATLYDVEDIMAINQANLPENYDYDTFVKIIEIYGFSYVATINEKVHGYILGHVEDGVEAHVTSLAVDESMRGLGMGKRLLLALLLKAKGRKLKACSLQVRESNTVAKALYEKMGFKSIRVLENYYGQDQNGIFMRRMPL